VQDTKTCLQGLREIRNTFCQGSLPSVQHLNQVSLKYEKTNANHYLVFNYLKISIFFFFVKLQLQFLNCILKRCVFDLSFHKETVSCVICMKYTKYTRGGQSYFSSECTKLISIKFGISDLHHIMFPGQCNFGSHPFKTSPLHEAQEEIYDFSGEKRIIGQKFDT